MTTSENSSITAPFDGVRVVEIAAWTFVPGAGAILADLGADVIKVEPPTGDPQRNLQNALNRKEGAPNPFLEVPNRGKRSITLDLTTADGHDLLLKLVEKADVVLTSYLPAQRTKLRVDVDDLLAVNPKLVYVRGTGWGSKGDKVNVGGFDAAAAWSAGGTMHKLTPPGADRPTMQPAAYYDLQGSSAIAGAVGMALFRRERIGKGGVVDVSLLNTGMWPLSPDLTAAPYIGEIPRQDRTDAPNPIVNAYRTKDDRWINLVCLQAQRFWGELCALIDRVDLIVDERFADDMGRYTNRHDCIAELDKAFAERTLDEWRHILAEFSGVWAAAATVAELHDDKQVLDNGFLPEVPTEDGSNFRVVAPPYHFDEHPTAPRRPAPKLGQHTEEILLEAGLDPEQISDHRERGVLG
ncbi:CaiB/BaiF family protein [Gordonia namibiensis NBRC 108229]|uniref:CaiB/BaiF family protein n=1 Tax=Gordonia namibiensis NBRC 108229 TaxID=1208314 RepID=K6X5N3_9ACTN|nr:CoA transferase [Gordonia namibiensis]GAC01382.1 CaiB/BaiF family protein [Gordonia namibiensis NBRC 108229]